MSRLRRIHGDFDGAARHIAIAEKCESSQNEMQSMLTSIAKTFVSANQGEYASVLPLVREVIRAQTVRHRSRWQPGWLVVATRTAVRADDTALAQETLQPAEQIARRNPNIAAIVGILEHLSGLANGDFQALQRATKFPKRVHDGSCSPMPSQTTEKNFSAAGIELPRSPYLNAQLSDSPP